MSNNSQTSLTQSVTRAVHILTCFTDETPLLRVTDISNQLDLTVSLVSRMLGTLEHEGFVVRDEDTGFYRLGRTIITLAGVALNHNRLRMEALNEMQRANSALGLGINLSVLDHDSIFYLAHIDPPEVPRHYTMIGRHNPLHATGMGKVLLASLPDDERAACIQRLNLYAIPRTPDRPGAGANSGSPSQGWARNGRTRFGRACIAARSATRRQGDRGDEHFGTLSTLRWNERRRLITPPSKSPTGFRCGWAT
ncbi:MAG: IclR family transcriptional regulator [Anaerolineae bacterium]|nr:IclR family transcriptional regulator [Anaerolineae bacterium]